MSSRSIRARSREPRGARRRARAPRPTVLLDALLDWRSAGHLPSAVAGFTVARGWLSHQDVQTRDNATAWLQVLVDECPDLLLASTHRKEIGASVVVRAALHASRAIRDVRDFRPAKECGRAQLDELLVHLFQRWPVPAWVTATMILPGAVLAVGGHHGAPIPALVPHIGQGGSYASAKLPVDVTRALARELTQTHLKAPRLAIRSCQLLAAGVSDPLVVRIVAEQLSQNAFSSTTAEAGLERFIAWLGRNPVGVGSIGLVCTHVQQRLRCEPDFTLAGRTASSLIEAAQLALRPHLAPPFLGPLPSSGIAGARVPSVHGAWQVRELLTGQELVDEGARRRHCVGTYTQRVVLGACALFTVEPEQEHSLIGKDAGVTVEVRPALRAVVQVKGLGNRAPSAVELAVIHSWAQSVGLRVSL
ncbi:MAG: PcfJ domain-containing protein [Deltaproteobacteria bacterium]|nr:PcfJ domain-containing protein [Deltaproteobacteria bacterium]